MAAASRIASPWRKGSFRERQAAFRKCAELCRSISDQMDRVRIGNYKLRIER